MNRRQILTGLMACPLCAAVARNADASSAVSWGYNGVEAPAHWSELSDDYAVCGNGRQQSPIDLVHAIRAETGEATVKWQPLRDFLLKNNGHTLQVDTPKGNVSTFQDRDYELLQFHFHHHSEHTLDGKRFPMEAHFVHKSRSGSDLLVMGVFLDEGDENDVLAPLWRAAPATISSTKIQTSITPRALLPENSAFYTYAGSLTTPPCSEIVNWVVYEQSTSASLQQIKRFAKLFPHNFRPRQALNRRMILKGR